MPDFGFVGEAYEAPSIYQDAQELINWFLEMDIDKGQGERGSIALYPTPGYSTVATLPTGSIRGMHTLTGGLFCLIVSGNTLYKIDSTYTYTSLGTLFTYTGRVYIEDNGVDAYIVDGPNRYSWNIASGIFTVIGTTSGSSGQVAQVTITNAGTNGSPKPNVVFSTAAATGVTGSISMANNNSIAWNGLVYVMIDPPLGTTNLAYISYDNGITFSSVTLPYTSHWLAVAWSGKIFCAVASNGDVSTSIDGINWTGRGNTGLGMSGIASNGTIFVSMISNSSTVLTSPDGITWTTHAGVLSVLLWNSVQFVNGKFFAIAQNSPSNPVIAMSTDGVTWTTALFPVVTATTNFSVAWNGSIYLIESATGQAAYSYDSVIWHSTTIPYTSHSFVTALNNVFLSTTGASTVGISNDAVTWYTITIPGTISSGIITNNETTVLILDNAGATGTISTTAPSQNGGTYPLIFLGGNGTGVAGTFTVSPATYASSTTFTQSTLPSSTTWSAIGFSSTLGTGQGRFVAIASGGTSAAYSDDSGSTWTASTLPAGTGQWASIAWNGTVFCAVGSTSYFSPGVLVATSPDGVTWTARTFITISTILQYSLTSIIWNGNKFCAIGTIGLISGMSGTSPDGITWTVNQYIASAYLISVAWSGTIFCAISKSLGNTTDTSYPSRAFVSTDGINWSSHTLPQNALWTSIAWSGTVFCAIASGGNIAATSPDGVVWTQRTIPIGAWNAISWNGSLFCAVSGTLGLAITSPDGITWTQVAEPTTEAWTAIAANTASSLFVGVASGTAHAMHGATTNTVTGGGVISTTITNAGSGYTTAPLVSFANATGLTGATGLAVLTIQQGSFQGADKVVILDNFFVYNRPNSTQFSATSALSTNTPALSFASKFGNPDNIVSIIATNRELFLLGEVSSEVWVNVGTFPFPFQIIPGSSSQHGCAAKDSVSRLADSFAFVSKDQRGQGLILLAQGYKFIRISTHAVENSLVGKVISDAVAYTYQIEGHEFYVCNFPTADITWVFDATTQKWHKWLSVDSQDKFHRHRGNVFAAFQGQSLIGDYSNGQIYALSNTTYTESGSRIKRLRRCPHLVSDLQRQSFYELQIQFQPGVGLATGQGVTPQAMLKWSDDGGSTWSNEHWRSIGILGAYKNRAIWRRLGQARDRIYEVSITDPVKAVVISANLKAEQDGN